MTEDGAAPRAARSTISLLAVLQLADGLFPAGGFAHSFGLETDVRDGLVRDAAGVADFVRAHLAYGAGPADAVAVARSAEAAARGLASVCAEADARLEAMKWVPEFRAASRQMGRQTARAVAAASADAFLVALEAAIGEGRQPGHHAVVFGAALGRHEVAPEPAAAAYLYSTAALLVGAALRLLPLGQVEGQRLLAGLRPLIAGLGATAAATRLEDMWSFTPGLEAAGVRHADLDGRLFRS
jgi:urease accessory protein